MTSYLCFALSVLHSTCEMRAGHNLGYLCCYYCVGSCGWHCAVVAMSMSHRLILDEFDFTNLSFALMNDGWPLFTSCGSSRKCSPSQDSIAATMSTHHPDSIGSILVRSSPQVLACCRNFMHVWHFMDRVCLWALKLKGLIAPHYPRQHLLMLPLPGEFGHPVVRRPDTSIRQGPGPCYLQYVTATCRTFGWQLYQDQELHELLWISIWSASFGNCFGLGLGCSGLIDI